MFGDRPRWLTFDCYGTLIQWDQGLLAAMDRILASKEQRVDRDAFIAAYDRLEHAMEMQRPHRTFREIASRALIEAMAEFSLSANHEDAEILTRSIGQMPPFPEVVPTLERLKNAGFKIAVISNTDDAIISGNISQLGGTIDRVITAEQAGAYKPSARIFEYAWSALGAGKEELVHICASPQLDLLAARELAFRAIWVDRGKGRALPSDYTPVATVSKLDEVWTVLRESGWI
ncbi:haloacid dehalogenase type II [Rhizobium cauense]|uniref:haloacid dehalogenase type II n=1 Tax=Rhizobium cauense TaxID=1166683 RepID=UPI001C6E1BCD|nr:haloacid dehalogenase type II [Rhizobium cauense]MBW9116466.1 haloacid dehalogenase type II [Rhizobium cauense]